ncbi:MAG: alpha/beta fold hydrolase [bacterium]|nr:alpha/beta fold hydrolase [bacterium]
MCRERFEMPDGDFLDVDFAYEPIREDDDRPFVLLAHGLEGSSGSGYAVELYRHLRRRGIAAAGLNFRSCGGEMNRLPRFYHSGETGDLRWLLGRLRERLGRRPLGAIGVSLGGNVLLKLLGESGESARELLDAAVAISVPFDLSAGSDFLERPGGSIYVNHLLKSLRQKVVAKRPQLPDRVDVAGALAARTFREFDDAATAPLHGFADAEDYYRRSSCGRFLDGIRVPTLLLHSADDPFVPAQAIPRETARDNAALTVVLTSRGGHIGFIAGDNPLRPLLWAEDEASRFLEHELGVRGAV